MLPNTTDNNLCAVMLSALSLLVSEKNHSYPQWLKLWKQLDLLAGGRLRADSEKAVCGVQRIPAVAI